MADNLRFFYNYKNRLMEDILTNGRIVKLIDPTVAEEDGASLIYDCVFPYEYLPETAELGRTYVCVDVDITKVPGKTYLSPVIYIWVFTHKSVLRLEEGGVRPDEIACEIDNLLNGSRFYGLGELDLEQVKRFAPMSDYIGKMMIYRATDFNRRGPTGKPIPSNRMAENGDH